MALDDVRLMMSECPSSHVFCDFESDSLCDYKNDVSARLTWKWRSGMNSGFMTSREKSSSNITNATSPRTDHTYGTREGRFVTMVSSIYKNESMLNLQNSIVIKF